MDDLSDLKAFALSVAAEVLPREIERLSAGELATLQSLCSEDEQTMLVDALASSFVTFLLVRRLSLVPRCLNLRNSALQSCTGAALLPWPSCPKLPSKTSRGTILTCRRGTCVGGATVKQPQLSRGAVS